MIPRRNVIAIAVLGAACASGMLVRYRMHLGSARYSLLGIISFGLALGVFYHFLISAARKKHRSLGYLAAAIVFTATMFFTIYRNHYIAYMPRRAIIHVADLIKAENRSRDTVILTYRRGNQLEDLVGDTTAREYETLNDPTAEAVDRLIGCWQYHDIFLVVRNRENREDQLRRPDLKLLGSAPDRGGKTLKVYLRRAGIAPEQNSVPKQPGPRALLDEEWRDQVVIDPAKIGNGKLAERKLPFALAGAQVKFPRGWSFLTINGFWPEGCDGDARVLPAPGMPGRNILRLRAAKPIRIYSPWIEYGKGDRFRLNLIARGGEGRDAELTVALQDFIAPGAYMPVHEVLNIPLKPGGFRFYTAEFDCAVLKGGKKFDLALDLQSGTCEVLFIALGKI